MEDQDKVFVMIVLSIPLNGTMNDCLLFSAHVQSLNYIGGLEMGKIYGNVKTADREISMIVEVKENV